MKISSLIFLFLIISGVIFIYGQTITEANREYPSSNMNISSWENEFDTTTEIQTSIDPIKRAFERLKDPEAGILTKIGSGLIALCYPVLLIPELLFHSIGLAGSMISEITSGLGIPAKIALLMTIGLIVWGVFELIKVFHKPNL